MIDWRGLFGAVDGVWGERAPLLILALACVAAIVWLARSGLEQFKRLQDRQDKRDEEFADRERGVLDALRQVAGAVAPLPALLESQRHRIDELAAGQAAGFRVLAEEIRESGRSA